MEKVLPNNLNYNNLKPIGYPSQIKQEKFTPISFNSASMSDVIRFNIFTNGFWDPYSAYVKIEVDTFGMDPVGVQQLDNSAHSFINQLIISNQGTEIERIEEYDSLAAILVDMNYSPESRSSRKHEGISSICGVQNNPNYNNLVTMCSNSNTPAGAATQFTHHGFNPNSVASVGLSGSANSANNNNLQNNAVYNNFNNLKRYEYFNILNSSQTVTRLGDIDNNGFILPQYTDLSTDYEPPRNTSNFTNRVSRQGYRQPFNYSLSSCSNEDQLSPNYLSIVTNKGLTNQVATRQKATYCIPLLSGLLGILMPRDSYKYIPMKALQNLMLEFRLNPYAMFSSGYQDTSSQIDVATVNQIRRFWKITKFEINVEMQYFESNVENIILNQLNSQNGIVLHTSSWQLGPRYPIPANTSPNGVYQVNLQFESLRNVIWFFMPDDFQTFNFCRKQYRLSENITQYYVKIGTQYFPNLPITGHGGNPISYGNLGQTANNTTSNGDSDFNNSEFLINLYKCFGKYQDVSTDSFIDPINFAINERVYNPATTGPLCTGQNASNSHTAGGNPLFHEQRCVGKACYAMNLEQLNNDFSVISGINTILKSPFEINLKSDNTGSLPFSRNATMYVFCQYDMLVQLKYSGVQVLGRG